MRGASRAKGASGAIRERKCGRLGGLVATALVLVLASSTVRAQGSDAAAASGTAGSPASAWDTVVLSFGGDAPEADAADARDAVGAALGAEGFAVVPEAEVAHRLSPARLREAGTVEALRALAAPLGARGVTTVAVWMSDGAPDSITVSLGVSERTYSATASAATGGVVDARVRP